MIFFVNIFRDIQFLVFAILRICHCNLIRVSDFAVTILSFDLLILQWYALTRLKFTFAHFSLKAGLLKRLCMQMEPIAIKNVGDTYQSVSEVRVIIGLVIFGVCCVCVPCWNWIVACVYRRTLAKQTHTRTQQSQYRQSHAARSFQPAQWKCSRCFGHFSPTFACVLLLWLFLWANSMKTMATWKLVCFTHRHRRCTQSHTS